MSPALASWLSIPDLVERTVAGLSEQELDRRGGSHGTSVRENVHHILESNLIASTIMLAALAGENVTYDWSWVWPNVAWMQRMGYHTAPIESALKTLRALCEYYAMLIARRPDALSRTVQLFDSPGGERYSKTVEDILVQEFKHAEEHLRDIEKALAA